MVQLAAADVIGKEEKRLLRNVELMLLSLQATRVCSRWKQVLIAEGGREARGRFKDQGSETTVVWRAAACAR